ncbi:MAG TPA: Rieske 2Fe-2S domain-containing protein [Planctomycetota bacterium]|nr:Rieske 2Fe-2S domain-containing protein [Planctomycetota bacterium]
MTPAWYIACASEELDARPLGRTVLDTPIVLFRDSGGQAGALLDRCAHRNVPLSMGCVAQGGLECAYHGWRYDREGACVAVPGLMGEAARPSRGVPSFAVREEDGWVWIFGRPGEKPASSPFRRPDLGPGYTVVRRTVEMEGPLRAVLENVLDVPHTAFLHRGLFRGNGERHRITVRLSRLPGGLQAEYLGEPRPAGLAAKILSPSGGVVAHIDRFILPSIAEVEYRLGTEAHFVSTSICTPIDANRTRLQAVLTWKTRLPGWVVRPFLEPVATRIFEQDAAIVKAQALAVRRFGGERYTSTAVDVLGLQLARLLEGAEPDPDWSREIEMEV